MFGNNVIHSVVDFLVVFATDQLMPLMLGAFCFGVFLKVILFFTIKREQWFVKEFVKRVHSFIDQNDSTKSFYKSSKMLLEKTYYEAFELRNLKKRRKPDIVMSFSDRVFLIQHGCARLTRDTLKQLRYLKHEAGHPKFQEISKNVLQSNSAFSKAFGLVSNTLINDVLTILPGMFIIGGIFGTFLGIMKALPELSGMDFGNVEAAQQVMDAFLLKISFSMSTSILGILLSVGMVMVNTLLSVEKAYMSTVDSFENAMDMIWNHSESNEVHRLDRVEGVEKLAQISVDKELGVVVDEIEEIDHREAS